MTTRYNTPMRLTTIILSLLILNSCTKTPRTEITTKAAYNNTKLATGILNYTVPGSWQRVQPSSAMRVDELLIDPISQTKLAIFIFPKIPGLVEVNIQRWSAQFKPGTATDSTEQFNQGELPVTIYQAEGSFMETTDPMNPGAEKEEKKDFKMLTAIIELNDGAWFFKTTGPKQVIDNQRANFDQLIHSLRVISR